MEDCTAAALRNQIQRAWSDTDPSAKVEARVRPDGKRELIVVSSLFEGTDSAEREALFWPAVRDLPRDLLVQMTYSLLLTPDEANRYFAEEAPDERTAI